MRWLAHRGGALDFREFAAAPARAGRSRSRSRSAPTRRRCSAPSRRCPTRSPSTSSPACCAAAATEVTDCAVGDAGRDRCRCRRRAEFVLEGPYPARRPAASPGTSEHGVALKEIGGYLHALEGPFGDHTGYYNEQDWFPVFEIERLTHRRDPIYHSTYTGKPPDEPAVLGRGAQRGLRADPAEAVSRDRRLLSAARGLQLPDGDRQHPQALPGPRQAA